jgi:hypothetical protein
MSSIKLLLPLIATLWIFGGQVSASDAPAVTVYKTPTCGCCGKWAAHLQANGFDVTTKDLNDLSQIKAEQKVPPRLASCHTAIVDGYVIEGHIPADIIHRLLKEKPPVVGLTVPGMPAGSPGMEVGYKEPYQVLSFDEEGKIEVYATR